MKVTVKGTAVIESPKLTNKSVHNDSFGAQKPLEQQSFGHNYECEICNKRFRKHSYLRKHQTTQHNLKFPDDNSVESPILINLWKEANNRQYDKNSNDVIMENGDNSSAEDEMDDQNESIHSMYNGLSKENQLDSEQNTLSEADVKLEECVNETFECQFCDNDQSMSENDDNRKRKCIFENESKLNEHYRELHPDCIIKCDLCPTLLFIDPETFNNHKQTKHN